MPFSPTGWREAGHQVYFGTLNYRETFLWTAAARADLQLLELAAIGSLTTETSARRSIAVDVSRGFVSAEGYFGRMSLGYLHFFPEIQKHAKLVVQTGILPTASLPWGLKLQSSLSFKIPKGGNVLGISMESFRHFGEGSGPSFELGGSLNWNAFSGDAGLGTHDYLLFSAGPWARLVTSLGLIRVGALWRLWLDIDKEEVGGSVIETNLSEFRGIPDLTVSWTLPL